jgi:hypothetical protein
MSGMKYGLKVKVKKWIEMRIRLGISNIIGLNKV